MTQMEVIPTGADLIAQVQKYERWNPVYRRALEELFRIPAFMCALNEVLRQSDEMLKNVGMTDLTEEHSIKNALRAQGIAGGLTQAVELICELASTPENPEENKDAK